MQDQFQLLQTVLNELRLPLTVDRRDQPRAGDDNDITVVLLSEIGEAVNIFFEGKTTTTTTTKNSDSINTTPLGLS